MNITITTFLGKNNQKLWGLTRSHMGATCTDHFFTTLAEAIDCKLHLISEPEVRPDNYLEAGIFHAQNSLVDKFKQPGGE